MFYLIKPDLTVLWADISENLVGRLAKDHPEIDIDYLKLPWQPSERRFDAGLLNIALRYGIAVPGALVVGAQALVELDYYRNMENILTQNQQRDSTNVPHAEFFETVMPGWTEHGRQLDHDIVESQKRTVERAYQDVRDVMSKPIDPALGEHWQSIGGPIPPQPWIEP